MVANADAHTHVTYATATTTVTTHCENRILPYSSESIFNLIADVESYPEFVPFWHHAKIWQRSGNVYYTDQEIGIGPVRERFQSKTVLLPFAEIQITCRQGVFGRLEVCWTFTPLPGDSCCVHCSLEGQTRSALLQHLFNAVFLDSIHCVAAAFEARANQRYGQHVSVTPGRRHRPKPFACVSRLERETKA
ncbi:MAG: type II toxin-antitoxin system RatA family toxin [Gammaproteobacteria bacterium]|jgi:coenzyme Q-binding protein COQ10